MSWEKVKAHSMCVLYVDTHPTTRVATLVFAGTFPQAETAVFVTTGSPTPLVVPWVKIRQIVLGVGYRPINLGSVHAFPLPLPRVRASLIFTFLWFRFRLATPTRDRGTC